MELIFREDLNKILSHKIFCLEASITFTVELGHFRHYSPEKSSSKEGYFLHIKPTNFVE